MADRDPPLGPFQDVGPAAHLDQALEEVVDFAFENAFQPLPLAEYPFVVEARQQVASVTDESVLQALDTRRVVERRIQRACTQPVGGLRVERDGQVVGEQVLHA